MTKVTIALPLDDSAGGQESIWGSTIDGGYAVDNIPLYAYDLSLGDTVEAVEREGILTYTGVIGRGGHSTYRVAFPSLASEDDRRKGLEALRAIGCGFERGPSRMVAIDVPPETDIYEDMPSSSVVWPKAVGRSKRRIADIHFRVNAVDELRMLFRVKKFGHFRARRLGSGLASAR
jgi:hypothetical protein